MPDGSIFVAAGSMTGLDPTNFTNNNPTYEVLDRNGISTGKNVIMEILLNNEPYWMYPFLHLLKDGTLFVFVSKSSQIFDVAANKIVKALPTMPGMFRTYPNTGGSVMLPLSRHNNYEPEVMICGGGGWQGANSPCEQTCGRIKPMVEDANWKITQMPEPRGMVEGVLLLDGTVLWINGAQQGAQGFGLASRPALEALLYDPKTDSWAVAGTSKIARLYHSVALLLLDGTVLVAGSNPNEMPVLLKDLDTTNQYRTFPTEFRVEIYTPPYLSGGKALRRPGNIVLSNTSLKSGSSFTVTFERKHKVRTIKVILYSGGFVTHAVHMGQVLIDLDVADWQTIKQHKVRVNASIPDIKLAPGPYVIYLMVDGVPGIGQFIRIET